MGFRGLIQYVAATVLGSSHLKAQRALVLRKSERRMLDGPPSGMRRPPDLGTVRGVETIG